MRADYHEHAKGQYALEMREYGATLAAVAAHMGMSLHSARRLLELAERLDAGVEVPIMPVNKLAAMLTRGKIHKP